MKNIQNIYGLTTNQKAKEDPNQASKVVIENEFKTVGDAVKYCEFHGLKVSHASEQLFEIANSLYQAFSTGINVGVSSQGVVFIDPHSDEILTLYGKLLLAAKELGRKEECLMLTHSQILRLPSGD